MTYEFKDKRCWRLWEAASPKGDRHMAAFAWRESPIGLERAWSRACNGKDADGCDKLLSACLKAASAQSAYRKSRLAFGERIPRPRGVAVWVNAGAWAEELEATGSSGEPVKNVTCQHCDAPMVHAAYRTCARHAPIHEDDSWREMLIRSRMRELEAWREQYQKQEETAIDFYRRVARGGFRRLMEKRRS